MRILIAEDDENVRAMLADTLTGFGHEVLPTADGVQAWGILQQMEAPKLAILDWMMPGMEGVEVVRRVRALTLEPPRHLILLTGRNEKTDVVAGFEAGADDYLAKPFHIAELRARIEVGRRAIETHERMLVQVQELKSAIEHINTLQGILPICMYCKKIRNDQGYWDQVETYIGRYANTQFSHGICPECMEHRYPEREKEDPEAE